MSKSIPIEQAVKMALEQHESGNFARAEALYIEILRQDPTNIDAMHLLGVLARQGHQPEVAIQLIGRAIARRDDVSIFHYNLAEAYVALGRTAEAIASYRRAIDLDPDYVASYTNLSNVLINAKEFDLAEQVCREALKLAPESHSILNNLGTVLRSRGQNEEARGYYEDAVRLQPQFPEALTNLAMCLCSQGKFDEGIERFREVVRLRPALADVHNNLGTALVHRKQLDQAIECFQTALEIKPDHVEASNNLGSALRALGKADQAIAFFRKAIEFKPDFVEAYANLAATFGDLGRNEDALSAVDKALGLHPDSPRLHFLRGILLRNLWRHDEGIAAIRKSLELDPDASDALTTLGYALLENGDLDGAMEALTKSVAGMADPQSLSNVLMTANYHPGFSQRDLFAMHRRWAELHEVPQIPLRKPHTNDRTPRRKLRIGYVSPDFRGHSVAYFLEPILANHDHTQFEIFGYANVVNFDLATYRLRTEIDHWRETAGKTLDEVSQMIRDDSIDILVELAGHTGSNLLLVFARKPAPVQINMIGFPSTTGLSAMDYRITDAQCDPLGSTEVFNSETLLRMSNVFWVYQPPSNRIEIGNLPADDNSIFTFTSVNNFTKVTPQVQAMWAKLLCEVPNSKLVIQTSATQSEKTQGLVKARFAAEGVDAGRLEFRPWSNLTDYLKLLERSDITLDPFPFNGGTTTCHSLWMGAPVLTLAGDRHASRMGLSMMTAIGLPEFVAYTPDEYVAIGKRMAENLPHLREIRRGMRERLLASPLLDGAGYTRKLEKVYRDVWQKWCATGV